MSRSSITRRLTIAFAVVMAFVLVGGGIGIYAGERFSLDRNLQRDLARQGAEIRHLVAQPGVADDAALRDRPDSYVQILTPDGEAVAATAPLQGERFLTDTQLATARHGVHTFQRGSITTRNGASFRIRTEAVRDEGAARIVVVATRRNARDEALRELVGQLIGFVAIALVLTVAIGYRLTRAALRPVERLRSQADGLFRGDHSGELDVPRTDDEIAALARTLNELLDRVHATVEQERLFAAAASHELRTPLAALKGELDLALRSPRSHAELLDAIRAAAVDTRRLITLAEDLLLLRMPDTELRRDPLPLALLVTAVAARRGIHAHVDPAARDAIAFGHRALVERALDNLVDNAERHGTPPIAIHLNLDASHRSARITVTDHGSGFAAEFLPRAFDQFARGAGTASGTGSGLGLAIVDAITSAHGGGVGAANTPEGAATWLELPLEHGEHVAD